MLRFFRKYHKWPGLILTVFILFFAISGIILNHRELLAPIDINRKWLPQIYRYNNWNLAAVKGAERIGRDSLLLYGNIGVWITDPVLRNFTSMNNGFPEGIDNRKINTLHWNPRFGLYAGTLFGLFRYNPDLKSWKEIDLPTKKERIVKVFSKGDSLMVLSRSFLMYTTINSGRNNFKIIPMPPPAGWDKKTGLFKTFWVVHSGEIYGVTGKLIIDAIGIVFIIICLTGIIYFIIPYRLKKIKNTLTRTRLKRFYKGSLHWHNFLGSWTIPLLILTTFTGMFLRPPLLIPIATARVKPIPFSELDNSNPWFDKLRDICYDPYNNRYLVATNEGIFIADKAFMHPLNTCDPQPPVSVMGINVMEVKEKDKILIGSFSGIFVWDPENEAVFDYISNTPYSHSNEAGPPFGAVSVSGYVNLNDSTELIFDYAHGIFALNGQNRFPSMPTEIVSNSPISLWNTSLEIHTGRIFEPLIGNFYIMVVPIVGLASLFIIITGFFSWWLAKRKRDQIKKSRVK